MEIQQIARTSGAFQQPVNEGELRRVLQQELPGERIASVAELDAGLFNNTYRVNTAAGAYILKVTPDPKADVFYNERFLMQRERAVAPHLEAVSPLIPKYLSFFNLGERDASLQPLIAGRLWHDAADSLTPGETDTLWTQLGAFANTLHSYSGDQFGYPPPFTGFRLWSEFIADNVGGMAEDCRRLGVMHPEVEEYCTNLPQFFAALDQVAEPRLLHGDLWPRNVIIDGSGENIHLKAVIDGERAFWGDPLSDWVLLLYGVPEAFWQGYGQNLLQTRDPVCVAVYSGMYFMLNILESVRFNESDAEFRKLLIRVNAELKSLAG